MTTLAQLSECADAGTECSAEYEEYLTDKMAEVRRVKAAMQDVCTELDEQIANLMKTRESLADPYNKQIAELEEDIRTAALLIQKPFKCDQGKVSFRKSYVKVSWDSKALDGYAAAHEEILQFRKTTVVKPSVSIQVVD